MEPWERLTPKGRFRDGIGGLRRYRNEAGLRDRSSRPHRSPRRGPDRKYYKLTPDGEAAATGVR